MVSDDGPAQVCSYTKLSYQSRTGIQLVIDSIKDRGTKSFMAKERITYIISCFSVQVIPLFSLLFYFQESFDRFFPEETSLEKNLWRGLLYTVFGLGALATMVAVRWRVLRSWLFRCGSIALPSRHSVVCVREWKPSHNLPLVTNSWWPTNIRERQAYWMICPELVLSMLRWLWDRTMLWPPHHTCDKTASNVCSCICKHGLRMENSAV